MKVRVSGTFWFGLTLAAGFVLVAVNPSELENWFDFMLGRIPSKVETLAMTGLGIVVAIAAFAAGASRFKASISPTNAVAAGVVVLFFALFLIIPIYLIGLWAMHAGWATLGTAVVVSFFAPLLFADVKQSNS